MSGNGVIAGHGINYLLWVNVHVRLGRLMCVYLDHLARLEHEQVVKHI
jgi:hypothetical protein